METPVKTELHTNPDAFDALQSAWDDLVKRSMADTPFSLTAWNRAWWGAYHPGDLWLVTCHTDDNELVGVAPWFIETSETQGRVVRFIGHIDVVDYMDIIADRDHTQAVYEALTEFLKANQDAYDSIGLANIHETSPTYTDFAETLQSHGFQVTFEQNDVAPRISLPADYDAYLSDILSSRERKETKRKMRKADGGLYDVAWYTVTTEHDLNAELQQFMDLMRSADQEKAEFLENEQHVDFFKRVMPEMQAADLLRLHFLTIDGTPCAAYLNFDHNGHIYVYNSGLEPDQFGTLSPGIVLLQYLIEHAIQEGHTTFDFLRGDESYKYKMGGTDTCIYQINATC
jgi:CelD/BcsL family acetyltransferase involved in cellulose biosynthesis